MINDKATTTGEDESPERRVADILNYAPRKIVEICAAINSEVQIIRELLF